MQNDESRRIIPARMKQYSQQLLRYPEMGISLDFSKLPLTDDFLTEMRPLIERAYGDIAALESGVIANPDENRMVGHYWLRNSAIAPTAELRAKIDEPLADLKAFAADVLGGKILAPNGKKIYNMPCYRHRWLCLGAGAGSRCLACRWFEHVIP